MNLDPTDEQRQIVATVRRFVREEIVPLEAKLDPDASELPREDFERLTKMVRDMGFWGLDIPAFEGESVSAALWASGIRSWSAGEAAGPPSRAIFCAMGVCQQCAVWIDGTRVEACRTPVRAGLVVQGRPRW